ncbi:hypothetical protein GCM10023307_27120 [Lysobacter hankyongensis]|uniref:Uncharacterized protein n=1 Tax=Lysobacter hankyongensis TaxID=1176535 RepID=A0ABP9BV66_9GAMM
MQKPQRGFPPPTEVLCHPHPAPGLRQTRSRHPQVRVGAVVLVVAFDPPRMTRAHPNGTCTRNFSRCTPGPRSAAPLVDIGDVSPAVRDDDDATPSRSHDAAAPASPNADPPPRRSLPPSNARTHDLPVE